METYGDRLSAAVAQQLRAERGANGLTIKDLSDRAEMNEQTVMRYLNGGRDVPVASLGRLSKALGITPKELIRRAEERIEG